MSRVCGICRSTARLVVDSALMMGESLASIARPTNFSEDAVGRHAARHYKKPSDDAATMAEHLLVTMQRLNRLATLAETSGDVRTSVEAVRSAISILEKRWQLAQAQKEQDAEQQAHNGEPSIEWLDAMLAQMTAARTDLDFEQQCPHCQQCGRPRKDQPGSDAPQPGVPKTPEELLAIA